MEAYGQVKGRKYPSHHEFEFKTRKKSKYKAMVSRDAPKTKVCSKCGRKLPPEEFYLRRGMPMQPCKACYKTIYGGR